MHVMFPRSVVRRLLVLALLVPALAAGAVHAQEEDGAEDDRNFSQRFVDQLQLGDPYQTSTIILFPLTVPDAPKTTGVAPNIFNPRVTYDEPEVPRRRDNVIVRNAGSQPALVLGGTVLAGGERDRLIRFDALVPPNEAAEVEALPASTAKEIRDEDEAPPFQASLSMASSYLRKKAQFGGYRTLVPRFVTHFLDFRNEGDERESLAAIHESRLLEEYCLACHQSMDTFPQPKEGRRVVGFVAAIRGRIQSLEAWGDHALFLKYFESVLQGYTFAAAAVEIQAEDLGIPIPGRDDPEKTLELVTEEANELLERLKRANYREDDVPEDQVGEAFILHMVPGIRGRALGHDGRLVHLTVFPHDPFEDHLYAKAVEPPTGDDGYDEREGLAELERRAEQEGRRLTEAEKRLLERLRERRGGVNRAPGVGGDVRRPPVRTPGR